jgi:hypothetical protein
MIGHGIAVWPIGKTSGCRLNPKFWAGTAPVADVAETARTVAGRCACFDAWPQAGSGGGGTISCLEVEPPPQAVTSRHESKSTDPETAGNPLPNFFLDEHPSRRLDTASVVADRIGVTLFCADDISEFRIGLAS